MTYLLVLQVVSCLRLTGGCCVLGSIAHAMAYPIKSQAHNVSAAQVCLRWIVQQGHALVTASAKRAYDIEVSPPPLYPRGTHSSFLLLALPWATDHSAQCHARSGN
jgi:hypothetical protein